jgi:hypothetical protein
MYESFIFLCNLFFFPKCFIRCLSNFDCKWWWNQGLFLYILSCRQRAFTLPGLRANAANSFLGCVRAILLCNLLNLYFVLHFLKKYCQCIIGRICKDMQALWKYRIIVFLYVLVYNNIFICFSVIGGALHHCWPLPGHLGSLQWGSKHSGGLLPATSSHGGWSADNHQDRRKLLQGAPLILYTLESQMDFAPNCFSRTTVAHHQIYFHVFVVWYQSCIYMHS